MELSSPKLKKLIIFQEKTCKVSKSEKKVFSEREPFKCKHKRKKVSYTFPYKQIKFSKSKHFLIIIIKSFFSFYNILYSRSFCFSSSKRFF